MVSFSLSHFLNFRHISNIQICVSVSNLCVSKYYVLKTESMLHNRLIDGYVISARTLRQGATMLVEDQ